jgi:DNA-binding response OmpR family regulator
MKPHILMVEDDTATGEVLTEVLRDAGYEVTLASDGRQALELLDQEQFAVVVSDIRMPVASGIDVLHAARDQDDQPEVILLTGYGALDTSLSALREGAFDYLLKPCNPQELLQRVSEAAETYTTRQRQSHVIQRMVNEFGGLSDMPSNGTSEPVPQSVARPATSVEPAQPIEIGQLRIGAEHHNATFQGEVLHLTPTEHALLRCLAEKPGRVFQYRELVYAMHGYDVTNIEAKVLLKTHIRNIRHKIGPDYLVNIRSTGYKLVDPQQASATPA